MGLTCRHCADAVEDLPKSVSVQFPFAKKKYKYWHIKTKNVYCFPKSSKVYYTAEPYEIEVKEYNYELVEREEKLRSALDRILTSYKHLLESIPVKDADEVIAEAEAALQDREYGASINCS